MKPGRPIERIKRQMQRHWRQQRMAALLQRMSLHSGVRIIDVGGTPEMWELDLDPTITNLDITLLNLPGMWNSWLPPFRHRYRFVEADACADLPFADRAFDIAFSNSVIEHVGNEQQQQAFANTIRRLAPSYWVQTPSKWFPIESHCNLPFWWFYPTSLQQAWIRRWQRQKQEFKWQQMSTTRVLSLRQLQVLFPEAQVYTEYVAGFPKSYSLFTVPLK
jgi:hypothetical protein